MPFQKDRVKPTAYPFLLFHSLRTAQLLSSIVVAGITAYFLRELARNGYSLPWTFILLLTVSLLTLSTLTLTIYLHTLHGLNPTLNLSLNVLLALLWSLSFALLTWWSSSTLASACAKSDWESEIGTRVCQTYKALFSFALLGLVGTFAALGLDVSVLRRSERRGRFMSLGVVGGGMQRTGRAAELDRDVDEGIWDSSPIPAALSDERQRKGQGYAVPEEQFGYADTGYGGAGELMAGRRNGEGRL